MWIVRLALNRPYTFVVLALLLFLAAPLVLLRTPVDIFPEINIPGRQRDLDLHGPGAFRNGQAHHVHL